MIIRRRARKFFPIVLAFALPVSAQAATVFADGREWRQVTETVVTSWNDLATACDLGTGVCGGAYAGWTWASRGDVASLFQSYLVPHYTLDSFGTFYSTTSVVAWSFLSDFTATQAFFPAGVETTYVSGLLRDADQPDAGLAYVVASDISYFAMDVYTPKSHMFSDFGAWMYQTAAPVPEPEIYAMMGLGLGLMGWAGRRKRLKEAQSA